MFQGKPGYDHSGDPEIQLNKKFNIFKSRVKKHLFRLQPVTRQEKDQICEELYVIMCSFIYKTRRKDLDRIMKLIKEPLPTKRI